MPHTFDIRFARSTGLAAILEAPANTFRWRGTASLSIDKTGVEIETRRGLFSLLARRSRFRINTPDLREVSRTGDTLRIEFGMPGTRRVVLPFWVRDAGTAAEIMRLVPTDRTVELDVAGPPPRPSRRRTGHMATLMLAGAIGLIVGASIVGFRNAGGDSVAVLAPATTPIVIPVIVSTPTGAPMTLASSPSTPPAASGSQAMRASSAIDGSTGLAAQAVAYQYASRESDQVAVAAPVALATQQPNGSIAPPRSNFFRAEALALQSEYFYGRNDPDLSERWWALSVRLYNSPEFDDWRERPLVDAQLGVSLNWRASLAAYADAEASGNQAQIHAARAQLEAANELTDRVIGFSD
jgi:hypothetical protein